MISSASTDSTDDIVKDYQRRDGRIRLVVQEKREGKNAAVNLFMKEAKGDILVLVNADNTLEKGALQSLIQPFNDPETGMVGGHPVPVNSKDSLVGFAVNLLWDMHHQLSLIHPKTGELIAFRNLSLQTPKECSTDEDLIRMEVEKRGYRVGYAPQAIVYNRGPTTLEDFWKQRVRVNIGEKYMKRRFSFQVPTWNIKFLFPAMVVLLKDNRRNLAKFVSAIGLELVVRAYASLYVALDKGDLAVWSMVDSTKEVK